ncbi:hypothetical protein [Dehalogenimonas etheniformans]|uniref:Uncharacterized protein n=1 Tax=Dehalogenimonas etheniformans TaxID=1536648 RepID=A0A2P5P4Z9_9CHLR|nr:hypothetical protein [Dehalogenimonas etheniformans]PPD57370.1 hypothetical protein JP09_010040 [Dehalogenimonas etheniformans]QNT75220.1 hypothetical protein HX448_00185 [Dehalogenimonas etheniformans]
MTLNINNPMPWEEDRQSPQPPVELRGEAGEPITALIRVSPDADAVLRDLFSQGVCLNNLATGRIIASQESAKDAADDLAVIAKFKKAVEEKGKEYTDPINAHLKAVRETVKGLLAPFEAADLINRQKLLAYHQEEERKRREIEEINRLREEAARREAELSGTGEISESVSQLPVPFVAKNVRGSLGTAGTSKIWKWECVDQAQVPEQFKVLDAGRIRKVIEAGGGVPGIKAWQEETIRVTTK